MVYPMPAPHRPCHPRGTSHSRRSSAALRVGRKNSSYLGCNICGVRGRKPERRPSTPRSFRPQGHFALRCVRTGAPVRVLPHRITLTRDPHCFRKACTYLTYIRPPGRFPIPRHPAARAHKPKLRQQLRNPKRVNCLGFFFVAKPLPKGHIQPLIFHEIAKQARGHGKLRQGQAGIRDLMDGHANPLHLGLARTDPGFDRARACGAIGGHCGG
jgi:hypothetical protein